MKAVTLSSAVSSLAIDLGARNLGDNPARRAQKTATLGFGLDFGAFDQALTAAHLAELDRLFPPPN
jgi:hypothetical protein